MKTTLKEWERIKEAAQRALVCVRELETAITEVALLQGRGIDRDRLLTLLAYTEKGELGTVVQLVTPQSEWKGGDSSDDKNFKMKEPHLCPEPRLHFDDKGKPVQIK